MRPALPALVDFLATRQPWWSADLFTVVLLDGTTLRYTSFDQDISFGGYTWTSPPLGPNITRSNWKMTNTTDVPDMTVIISSAGLDYNGQNFKLLAHQGFFDGASMMLERAVMPTPGDVSLGLTNLFEGKVSSIEIDGIKITLTIKALSTILQTYMPRNIYTTGCSWALYGSGCTLSRAAHTATNTAAAGSSSTSIKTAGPWVLPDLTNPAIAGMILGTINITSGFGTGQSRTILGGTTSISGGQINIGYPLYRLPSAGDTLTLYLGCNKTQERCTELNNIQHYRGFDFIPPAETVI